MGRERTSVQRAGRETSQSVFMAGKRERERERATFLKASVVSHPPGAPLQGGKGAESPSSATLPSSYQEFPADPFVLLSPEFAGQRFWPP